MLEQSGSDVQHHPDSGGNIMLTAIVTTLITPGTPSEIKATIVWPNGEAQRLLNLGHDWSNDSWNWRNGRLPDSILHWFRDESMRLHGERVVYVSPANVGTDSNEQGRVMVYEVDYEA